MESSTGPSPLSYDLEDRGSSLTQNDAIGLLRWLPHDPHRCESHFRKHEPHGWAWGCRKQRRPMSQGPLRCYVGRWRGCVGLWGLAWRLCSRTGRSKSVSDFGNLALSEWCPNDLEKTPHFESSSSAFQVLEVAFANRAQCPLGVNCAKLPAGQAEGQDFANLA